MRGSASPQGEARRERAAKPKQSDGRGREDYGWGWAGRFNQTIPGHPLGTPSHNTRGSTPPESKPQRNAPTTPISYP